VNKKHSQVLICGGGPAGLTAALLFHQRGWRDIVVLERRKADQFERGKAFNYQLDGRGQLVLEQLGIGTDTYRQYGLANDSFKLVNFFANGRTKTTVPPILTPDRKISYWMVRQNLIRMLCSEIESRNDKGRIRLLYGHSFDGFAQQDDGTTAALATDPSGHKVTFQPELLLGCDGLNSKVRSSLGYLESSKSRMFEMVKHSSPSAELKFKVIQFPPSFGVKGSDEPVNKHEIAYAFLSKSKKLKKKMALFALPVANSEAPRTINIILHKDHEFWKISSSVKVRAHLRKTFPQLDIDGLLSETEMEEFSSNKPGQFPEPQYSKRIHTRLNMGSKAINCLLIGDSAHAFPPDLGLGVNSALEDLYKFNQVLDDSDSDLFAACSLYEKARLPNNRALVRLVQTVFPYQYNQVPWRLKLWMLKFVMQLGLNKISRGLTGPPGFLLTQQHLMDFVEMEQRRNRSEIMFYVSLGLIIGLLFLISVLL